MKAAIIVIILIIAFVFLGMGKAAGKDKRFREANQNYGQPIEPEFNGYLYCDDDCYMCDYQETCKSSAMKLK